MAVIINGTSGITNVNGSASTPAETGTDTDTGIYYGTNTVGLATNGTNALFIDASQNVGIGTSSPSKKVEVYAAANSLQIESIVRNDQAGSGVAAIGFNVSSGAASETTSTKAGIGLVRQSAYGVGSLCFYNNGTSSAGDFTTSDERMRIDSSGNFAVGGATIASRSSFYNGNINRPVSIGSGNIYMQAETGGWTLNLWCLGSTGTNLGGFGFAGTSNALTSYTVGTAAGTGVQLAYGATSWTTWSDIRDKNVVGQVQNGLAAINALEPIYFLYKNDPAEQRHRIGFSAQNVQSVIPEAVVELEKDPENPTEDSKRLALSMTDMIPVLVKAIQEQQALITQLQADIATLKGQK